MNEMLVRIEHRIYDDATLIYNFHPQLELENKYKHFKRVNDAFTMFIVMQLQCNIGLSQQEEAMKQ